MPKKKVTPHDRPHHSRIPRPISPLPLQRPHTVSGGANLDVNASDQNSEHSEHPSSNSNSDELAVALTLSSKQRRISTERKSNPKKSDPQPKLVHNGILLSRESVSSYSGESHKNEETDASSRPRRSSQSKNNPPSSRNISSAPVHHRRSSRELPPLLPAEFKDVIEPTKVYSKTLASLGRPMSRVATAFIADIIAPTQAPYASTKKKSYVKFTDDFDVLDVNNQEEEEKEAQRGETTDDDKCVQDGTVGSSQSSDERRLREENDEEEAPPPPRSKASGLSKKTKIVQEEDKDHDSKRQGRNHHRHHRSDSQNDDQNQKMGKYETRRELANNDDEDEEEEEEEPSSEQSDKSSSTSNSDAAPPPDPTVHVGIKKRLHTTSNSRHNQEGVSATPTPSGEVKEVASDHGPHNFASNFVFKNQLFVKNLPLPTTIDELKIIFPKAISIKLMLTKDRTDKYRRSATIEFADASKAKSSYKLAKDTRIGESVLEFFQHKVTLHDGNVDNVDNANEKEDSTSDSEESEEDFLPKEKMDKDQLVLDWIKIQNFEQDIEQRKRR